MSLEWRWSSPSHMPMMMVPLLDGVNCRDDNLRSRLARLASCITHARVQLRLSVINLKLQTHIRFIQISVIILKHEMIWWLLSWRFSLYMKEMYILNQYTLQEHDVPNVRGDRSYLCSPCRFKKCVIMAKLSLYSVVYSSVCCHDFTCILDFDALKMVVSKSSPKINSRGMIHFPSVRVMLPRSFTMLGWFALLQISGNKSRRERDAGKSAWNKNETKWQDWKIRNHHLDLLSWGEEILLHK